MAKSSQNLQKKHCGKWEELLIMHNFSFRNSVFKRLVKQTRKLIDLLYGVLRHFQQLVLSLWPVQLYMLSWSSFNHYSAQNSS